MSQKRNATARNNLTAEPVYVFILIVPACYVIFECFCLCLFVCLFVCLLVCLFVCLFVCLLFSNVFLYLKGKFSYIDRAKVLRGWV